MCGCEANINLGCFESCTPIATNVEAPSSGIWTVQVCFNGVWLKKEIEVTAGAKITIPNDYPEGLLLKMQLIQPNGNPYNNNTYSFTNKITITA